VRPAIDEFIVGTTKRGERLQPVAQRRRFPKRSSLTSKVATEDEIPMTLTAPRGREMFSDAKTDKDIATRFEQYLGALNKSFDRTHRGEVAFNPGDNVLTKNASPTATLEAAYNALALNKSASPEVLAGIKAGLETQKMASADLGKDFTLTSPLSTGYVPYDLEAPAKFLIPLTTPLRNMTPRLAGQGTSRRFKRITGISNSGTGGVAALNPFITDTSTMTAGSLTLRRGPVITYAGDEKSAVYKQMGLSDNVTWSAEFSSLGYGDARELSHTAVLYASMLADERAILGARGTDAGVYVGALSAPSAPTSTARTAAAGETGNTANIASITFKVSAVTMQGETLPSSASSANTSLSAATGKVIDVTITDVTGAVGYNIYGSTDATNYFLWAQTGYNLGTVQFTGAGTGGAINTAGTGPVGAATDSLAAAYDGYLSVLLDPTQAGVVSRLNAAFSTSTPGSEYQNVFATLYANVRSDPDRILINGFDRKQLSNAVIAGTTTPGYRLQITQDEVSGVTLGSMVTTIVNEVTGKPVDLQVHPFMPQGNSLVLSDTLPVPNSNVSATVEYHLPQDYVGINWPVTQHLYEIGSYWYGALCHYAPAWSASVVGIRKA
jgi:hypothetical protein